jgi:iron complex transport system permease protein
MTARPLRALAYTALWGLLLVSATFAVTFGPADISAGDAWASVLHHLGLRAESPLSHLRDAIVWDLRLPRVLAALGLARASRWPARSCR